MPQALLRATATGYIQVKNWVFHANKVRMSEGLSQKPVSANMEECAHLSATEATALAAKQTHFSESLKCVDSSFQFQFLVFGLTSWQLRGGGVETELRVSVCGSVYATVQLQHLHTSRCLQSGRIRLASSRFPRHCEGNPLLSIWRLVS